MNRDIRAPQVRLIDAEGNQAGVMSVLEALKEAQAASLDLVEISPQADPPVCRIMDHGKFLYSQKKRTLAAKKKQKQIQIKEIKFRPGTDIGDYKIKVRKIIDFLSRGDKVKISIRFRGREMQHRELGMDLLKRVEADLPPGAAVEQQPKVEGRQMTMVVAINKASVKKDASPVKE